MSQLTVFKWRLRKSILTFWHLIWREWRYQVDVSRLPIGFVQFQYDVDLDHSKRHRTIIRIPLHVRKKFEKFEWFFRNIEKWNQRIENDRGTTFGLKLYLTRINSQIDKLRALFGKKLKISMFNAGKWSLTLLEERLSAFAHKFNRPISMECQTVAHFLK